MESESIKLAIVGDLALVGRVRQLVIDGDYKQIFGDILPVINETDYSIANLEIPMTDNGSPIAKTGPAMKVPTKSVEAIKYAGFDMVTLANNHIMDYGAEGLLSTVKVCRENGIRCVGVGTSLEEAEKIAYIELKGKKISIINIAENEWSTTHGSTPGANPLDEVSVWYQIKEAKANSDYVVMVIHGGHEHYGLPSPRMKKLYRWFIDLGCDAVIGHHTHCFCGDEVYKGHPIVYSLGNFVFDAKVSCGTIWNKGAVAILEFKDGKTELKLIPYNQNEEKLGVYLDKETEAFDKLRADKTAIIQSDKALNDAFEKFVSSRKKMRSLFLEPIKNRYYLALVNRGLFPSLSSQKYRRLLLNMVRAEAHRDILLKILSAKP